MQHSVKHEIFTLSIWENEEIDGELVWNLFPVASPRSVPFLTISSDAVRVGSGGVKCFNNLQVVDN